MLKKITALLLLIQTTAAGQETAPLVKGKVDISLSKGTITCDMVIERSGYIKDYLILLNAGMNVRNLKRPDTDYPFYYERSYNSEVSYEAFGYYLPDNSGKEKFLPDALQMQYTGKFPVVNDTLNPLREDWKGNIAFNGYSVRTDGSQAAWYPILYDVQKDKTYDKVRYDIEVNCDECTSIYINGSKPVPGSKARLKSDEPMEMLLYAGRYMVDNVNGTFFLNAQSDRTDLEQFGEETNRYKKFYESKLGIPYKYNITYLNSTPVSKENAWLFVSYPTIAIVGHGANGMQGFFDDEDVDWEHTFIAHELAHYYFGSYRHFNSEVGDLISEGFAEYMSAQLVRHFYGDSIYQKQVGGWIKNTKNFKPVAISALKSSKGYGSRQRYVYNYVPLLLTAIERETSNDVMWQWMKQLLQADAEHTDFAYLEQCLTNALNDKTLSAKIHQQYFQGDATLENVLKTVVQ